MANNGSRFGLRLTQQLGEGFYALGRVEWRARGLAPSQHNFDDWYAHQLYAGIGHKQYGELTYGNQTVITDEVKQTDLANTLSLSDGLLTGSARRSVQYTYSGIQGLKVGAYFGAHSPRGSNGLDITPHRKDVLGAAAVYKHKIDDVQSITFGAGVSRDRMKNQMERDSYAFGTAYTFGKTTMGLDLERSETDNYNQIGTTRVQKEVRTILFQNLTNDWNAYTMYAHKQNKVSPLAGNQHKAKSNQFMVGTEYYLAKETLAQYQLKAKTFVEWQTSRTQNYTNGVKNGKSRNNETVIGFRLYW